MLLRVVLTKVGTFAIPHILDRRRVLPLRLVLRHVQLVQFVRRRVALEAVLSVRPVLSVLLRIQLARRRLPLLRRVLLLCG